MPSTIRLFTCACLVGLGIQCIPAAAPVADLAACIAGGALAKHTIAQIALDCGADVLSVVDALLASEDPSVAMSPAGAEAHNLQNKMQSNSKK